VRAGIRGDTTEGRYIALLSLRFSVWLWGCDNHDKIIPVK
jgi:hypothetical protein